jgi:phenylacetate-CoA ligase
VNAQPSADVLDKVRDIPLYRPFLERGHFPILEKPQIAQGFPGNWMTPELARALEAGEAEFVLSTGTNHARMQLIRPPYFLLRSYYRLWSEHPDLGALWHQGARRVSLTTVLATEHVARVNARRPGATPGERWLDDRTLYLNRRLDPAGWDRGEVERMLAEIRDAAAAHPGGAYLLDCSGYHLAHLVRKVSAWGLWDGFPRPAGIVHAYEYTPLNVRAYLRAHFGCPVIDLFGSTELGYLFYSDAEGRYRPHLEDMSVELIPVEPGSGIHSLIVTSVRNPYMPLVRYRSGDCVRTRDDSADPERIVSFCGREKELLPTPRGPVSQADLDARVADACSRIFLHQLHLTGDNECRLAYTTFDDALPDPRERAELAASVSDLTGRACRVEHRTGIPVGRSGKYAWLTTAPGPS